MVAGRQLPATVSCRRDGSARRYTVRYCSPSGDVRTAPETEFQAYGTAAAAYRAATKLVPPDFPVRVIPEGETGALSQATCGQCGRSWDDAIPTDYTPAPSARCPFESFH